MKITQTTKYIIFFMTYLLLFAFSNCSKTEFLLAEEPITVLSKGYPEFYNEIDNEVMEILEPGSKVKISSIVQGKDYRAYKVVLPDGREGYVIGGGKYKIE